MRGFSALAYTRHCTRRVPGVPGSAKRRVFNRGHELLHGGGVLAKASTRVLSLACTSITQSFETCAHCSCAFVPSPETKGAVVVSFEYRRAFECVRPVSTGFMRSRQLCEYCHRRWAESMRYAASKPGCWPYDAPGSLTTEVRPQRSSPNRNTEQGLLPATQWRSQNQCPFW